MSEGERIRVRSAWPLPPPHYDRVSETTRPPRPPSALGPASVIDGNGAPSIETTVYDMPLVGQPPDQDAPLVALDSPTGSIATQGASLVRAILVAFVQLVGVLHRAPAASTRLLEHLDTLFRALHAALNAIRPQQARATLRSMLESQIKRRSELLVALDKRVVQAQRHLNEARRLAESDAS